MRSAALLAAGIALASCGPPAGEGPASRPPRDALAPGDLAFRGLSISGETAGETAGSPLSLSVERAHSRRRRSAGGLFVYRNLDDLTLSGVVLALPAPGGDPLDLPGALGALLGRPEGLARAGRAQRESEARVVSRVRFEDLTLRIHLAPGRVVAIDAPRARADGRFEALVFERGLEIRDVRGTRLSAPHAIWPRDPAGVRVPAGHAFAAEVREREAFFVLDGAGRLAERGPVPPVAIRDPLREFEERLLGRVQDPLLLRLD